MKSAGPRFLLSLGALLWVCLSLSPACGQAPKEIVQLEAYGSHQSIRPGEAFQIAVVLAMKPGFHINSSTPSDKSLIPTTVKFKPCEDIVFSPVSYPMPEYASFPFSAKKMPVYSGRVFIFCRGKVSEVISPGHRQIMGVVDFQLCSDKTCFMPDSVSFEVPLEVVKADEPVRLTNKDFFQQHVSLTTDEVRAKQIVEKGLAYAVMAFFLLGLALNLTPCVYPIVPITVAFFSAQSGQKRSLFILASHYVMGIAAVFSALGLVCALAGRQWGFLFQHPWFVVIVSIAILSMAASMFGAFELTIPPSLMTKLGKSRKGSIGAFVMGLTVGVVIAPCTAGIIVGLIGMVAKLGMVAKGTLLFFVMGLGLGLPYLILAMSSGLLNRLPKSGFWMVWIQKVFGLFLIAVALYLLVPQAKQFHDQQSFYLGVLGMFGGLLLGFLEHRESYGPGFKVIRAIFGSLLILGSGFLVEHSLRFETHTSIDWINYKNESFAELVKDEKPVLMDFYADWCVACRKLDDKTFSDKGVANQAKQFTMVRVDCTSPREHTARLTRRLGVSGLPTIVFLNTEGKELPGLRVVGFLEPREMLRRMKKATPG
jgi:thiol:disulfide interchange protein DsbD